LSNIIDISGLSFSYNGSGIFAVSDINTGLKQNDFVSVIGRNGSGKSTLARLICRIINDYTGEVKYFQNDIKNIDLKEYSRIVSYLPQSGLIMEDDMNVYDLLLRARYPYKKLFQYSNSRKDKEVADAGIKFTGIENLKNKFFNKLSGGEKQKVIITFSLVQLDITSDLNKKILIVDEPLTYLDISVQMEVFSLLRKLNEEKGLTIAVITHDLNFALKFTKSSVLMEKGRIIEQGETKDIINEEILKKHFLINSKIVNFNDEFHINYKTK
jgi:iron complex transport system ATP-binding protein